MSVFGVMKIKIKNKSEVQSKKFKFIFTYILAQEGKKHLFRKWDLRNTREVLCNNNGTNMKT